MAVTVRIEGLRELDHALGELPKATARNVLRRVLKKAAEPTLSAMEAHAPRDTGWTAGSIAISSTLNRSNRGDVKREGKAFAEVYVGSDRGSAAVFQEWGTVNQPAHPYMRPAWEGTKERALEIIGKELGSEIEKAAARLARKLARSG